ncbi:helicase C-terminal domain-containing protein [Sporodiniella umbellata]|nr:helicase C-terminal domain-containing protein [Sporodiniella umbellata]
MEVKLKKEYNDQKRMNSKNSNFLSGREWYSIQAYRAINQALGRCIRHKNDWGAIILLEDRFQAQETIKGLSKWIRGKIQIHQQFSDGMSGLEDFVQSRLRIQNGQNASEQEQQAKLAVGNQQAYVTTEPKEKSEAISPTPRITIETEAEQKNIQSGEVYSSSIIDNQDLVTIQTNMIKNNVIQGLPDASWEDNIPTIQNIDNDSNALRKAEEVCVIENEDQQAVNAGSKLDALLIEIDSDSEFESCEPVQQQTHNFFKKPSTSKARNNLRPVACSRCEHVLMEGDTDLLKPIDNIHLNCILYSNQMDTRMVEVQEPSTWGATTLNLDIAQLPTEAPVLMNKIDKLCYQKLHCKCNQVVGVLICGAISPEKENYVGKVYFWEDSVKYEKERQRAWKQPVKKDDIDDSWNASASSQVTTMTDMFYNLP